MTPRKYVPGDKPTLNELVILAMLLLPQERKELAEWLNHYITKDGNS